MQAPQTEDQAVEDQVAQAMEAQDHRE